MARATDLIGLPVVTFAGEDIAEIKDVVYEPAQGGLVGFTLNKRGFFAGRLKLVLAMDAVHALGRDAVMVEDESALVDTREAPEAMTDASSERNVIGAAVITDGGKQLGTVTDVVVSLGTGAEAVGYELGGSAITAEHGRRPLFIPLPEQLAVSGEALMVPAEVEAFVRDDLSGFGAAVADFRARLHHESEPR
ncbi:MAG: PRC-barrel domain protein [Actinomycetia bacterium]|nr:PRC-barrel domain protein [Actinomycetes bacterium]